MKSINSILYVFLFALGFNSCQSDNEGLPDLSNRKFVRIDKQSVTVKEDESCTITASFDSDETASKNFTWSILNTSIATVVTNADKSGTITGLVPGETTIKIESQDGSLMYFSTLYVLKNFVLECPLFIDFGPWLSDAPFNNLASPGNKKIENLKDEKGNNTNFGIEVVGSFNTLQRALNNTLGFPDSAVHDMFFNDGINVGSAGFIVSNLNKKQKYTFVFYGTINDNNTETEYVVKGSNEGSVLLNSSYNTSNLAYVRDILSDSEGNISITLRPGPNNTQWAKFYGINLMIMLPEGYDFKSALN